MSRRLPHLLHDDAPERLIEATVRQRDRLLLLTLLYCGLRNDEACGLEVPDLDFRRRTLFVRSGKGDKDRLIPLPRFLVGPLRGFVGARSSGPVFRSRKFGKALTPRGVQQVVKAVAARAKLPDSQAARRYHPHALRHVYATRLLRAGADIMEVKELLGHASLASTMVYLHADGDRLRAAVDRLTE